MNRTHKWAEYRRILGLLYSVCWDCGRPCSECRSWARDKAFGREPKGWLADACRETYEAAEDMQRRGISVLIIAPTMNATSPAP